MEELKLVQETSQRIFADLCVPDTVDAAEQGTFPAALWQALSDNGLTHAHLEENRGGSGGGLPAAFIILREAGRACAPVPLAETLLANWLLAGASISPAPARRSVARHGLDLSDNKLSGSATLPGGGHCDEFVFLVDDHLVVMAPSDCQWQPERNMAGEVDALVTFAGQPVTAHSLTGEQAAAAELFFAAARAQQMAGAIEAMLALSVDYAQTRSQFGKPIAGFQAIQQQLAILAGEAAASVRAADALLGNGLALADVAIAKARIGEASSIACDIAHQVHGAIGYTLEHQLNHRSRRLWVWRDEAGNERYWQHRLGNAVLADGADGLWPFITNLA